MIDKEANHEHKFGTNTNNPSPSGKDVFPEIVMMIQTGQRDAAVQAFVAQVGESLRNILSKRYRWTKAEAETLIHDTFLLIEEKILAGSLEKFNFSYVKRICLNLGANQYRHVLVQQNRFQGFVERFREEYFETLRSYSGIDLELYGGESQLPIRYKKALLAFENLGKKCQQLIKLRHVQDLSHQEIAQQLDNVKHADSSKTLLNRCMKKWQSLLKSL